MAGMLLSLVNQPAEAAGLSAMFRTTATALPEQDGEVKLPELKDLQPGTLRRALPPNLSQLPTLTAPTQEETSDPTLAVTGEPTQEATVAPTLEETLDPTGEATLDPTGEATLEPTGEATTIPTTEQTNEPPAITGSVRFSTPDTAVCALGPGSFEATVEVSLSGGSAILQTAWRIAEPVDLRTPETYSEHDVSDGDEVTISGDWPGVRPGDQVVEIHFGAILLDPVSKDPISDGAGIDYYWYPWVCPPPVGPTVSVGTATTQPTEVEGTEVVLTETATATATVQATVGATEVVITETSTSTVTETATATLTLTPTPSDTPTPTETSTPTFTPTASQTPTVTNTATFTATPTVTNTATFTATPTVTNTATFTATPTVTNTATFTATPTATNTPTFTLTPTATNTPPVIVGGQVTPLAPTAVEGEEAGAATPTVDVNVGGGGPMTDPEEQLQALSEDGAQDAGGGVPVTGDEQQNLLQPTAVLGVESTVQVMEAPQPFAAGEEQFIPATGADLAPRALPLTGIPLAQKTATYLGLLMIGIAFIIQGLGRKL